MALAVAVYHQATCAFWNHARVAVMDEFSNAELIVQFLCPIESLVRLVEITNAICTLRDNTIASWRKIEMFGVHKQTYSAKEHKD